MSLKKAWSKRKIKFLDRKSFELGWKAHERFINNLKKVKEK